jgi:hypothetical protein
MTHNEAEEDGDHFRRPNRIRHLWEQVKKKTHQLTALGIKLGVEPYAAKHLKICNTIGDGGLPC